MAKEEKLEWIYKGANSLVDREEYLMGRKVDKTLEQLNEEERVKKFALPTPKNHVEHECIPPSIRDYNKIVEAEQVDMSAKLQEDPLIAIKKREEEARRQFLQNPVQLKKLQEALQAQQAKKKKSMKGSKLDEQIVKKLKILKSNPSFSGMSKKEKKKQKEHTLDTILMHKFNALKDKLSQNDLDDIMNGKIDSDSNDEEEVSEKMKNKQGSQSRDHRKDDKVTKNHDKKNRSKQKGKSSDSDADCNQKETKTSGINYQSRSRKDRRRSRSSSRSKKEYKHREKKRHRSESSISSDEEPMKTKSSRSTRVVEEEPKISRSRDEKSKKRSRDVQDSKSRRHRSRNRDSSSDYRDSGIKSDTRDTKSSRNINRKPEDSHISKKVDVQSGGASGSESDTGLDAIILKKLKSLRNDVDLESNNEDTKQKKRLPEKPAHLRHRNSSSNSESDQNDPVKCRKQTKKYDSDSDHQNYEEPKCFGLVSAGGKKISLKYDSHQRFTQKSNAKDQLPAKPEQISKSAKKLSEEEKEKLREEMMKNALVRDKERESNVRKYREQDSKEEEHTKKKYNKDLVYNELVKSTRVSTVEERIKSNVNNIQRSSRHMETNFSRK